MYVRYREVYEPSRNWSFVVMDPSSDYWQSKLSSIVSNLTEQLGVSGVYVDQISCAPAMPCATPSVTSSSSSIEPHRWVSGYRSLFDDMHRSMRVSANSSDSALMSEAQAEPFLDKVDINLAIYGLDECRATPLVQAVYGGYTAPLMGTKLWIPGLNGTNFRARLAQMLTFGVVPGWFSLSEFGPVLTNANNTELLQFLADIVAARAIHSDLFAFGRIIDVVDGTLSWLRASPLQAHSTSVPGPVCVTSTCCISPVLSSVFWEQSLGATAFVVNHGTQPVSWRGTYRTKPNGPRTATVELDLLPGAVVAVPL